MKVIYGCVCLLGLVLAAAQGQETKTKSPPEVLPLAVLPFQERGPEVKGQGAKASDILFAELAAKTEVMLVDREDLKKTLDEQELSVAGLVNPAEATKVGHLTGARVLVTGSVLQTDRTLYVVAKIIGVDTGRVLGASVKGNVSDKFDVLVAQLSEQIVKTLTERGEQICPKFPDAADRLIALKEKMPKGKKPIVFIQVAEQHIGQRVIDPAVQTLLGNWCKELGFEVLDPEVSARSQADMIITGEGFSEFAARTGNLVSVKSRVEIKITDRATNKITAVDREVALSIDLAERIAGKRALEEAAMRLAERVLPKLVVAEAKEAK